MHEKQDIVQKDASCLRKTLLPKRVRFLAIDTQPSLTVCLSLRQEPLEAILVIFSRRALICFCLKALGKK